MIERKYNPEILPGTAVIATAVNNSIQDLGINEESSVEELNEWLRQDPRFVELLRFIAETKFGALSKQGRISQTDFGKILKSLVFCSELGKESLDRLGLLCLETMKAVEAHLEADPTFLNRKKLN